MAAVQIVPNASRGSLTVERNLNAGAPRTFRFKLTSAVFPTDPSLSIQIQVNQSFTGGAPFSPWFGFGMTTGGRAGQPTRGGVSDGLPVVGTSFDGVARRLQVVVDCPTAFVWGLTIEEI